MDAILLRELATDYLLPLFSGAIIEGGERPTERRDALAGLADPCTIHFKVSKGDNYRLSIRRSQKFARATSPFVTELNVVKAFVEAVGTISDGLETAYGMELRANLQRRVVITSLVSAEYRQVMLAAADLLTKWSSRLYEGQPVTAGIGFDPDATGGGVNISDLSSAEFAPVPSNGVDSLYLVDGVGRVVGHAVLDYPKKASSFAPLRHGPVAEWTTGSRVTLLLNRLGEILAFKDKRLLFAWRSGNWYFLTHEPALTQMGGPNLQDLRAAVYESCLDASFARTGACVGLVTSSNNARWRSVATFDGDYLDDAMSTKAKTVSLMVNGKPFHELHRRLRQELLAIDGATLLDHTGKVLAVGAILKVPGGSTGGGRLAAAKALAELGVGIKVSQDGGIRGFRRGSDEPTFSIM